MFHNPSGLLWEESRCTILKSSSRSLAPPTPLPLQCTYKVSEAAWKVKMKNTQSIPCDIRDFPYLLMHPTAHERSLQLLTDQKSFCQKSNFYSSQIRDKSEPKEIASLKVSFTNGGKPRLLFLSLLPIKVSVPSLGLHINK